MRHARIVEEIRHVAALAGKTCIRAVDLEAHGRVRYHVVVKHFGNLRAALDAASDEELLALLAELWRKMLAEVGRRQRVDDVAKYALPVCQGRVRPTG